MGKIMKKFLVTTALMSVAGFAAAAHADAPTVTIGGYSNVEVGVVDQASAYKAGLKDTNVRSDNEVDVKVMGKADNGMSYGAVIALEADTTRSDATTNTNNDVNSSIAYIFAEDAFGRVELGGNVSAVETLQVDASNFASATGGISGDWYYFVNTTFLTGSTGFIVTPDLVVEHGASTSAGIDGGPDDGANANKVTYYTPRMSGFQLGLSFTPNTGATGNSTGFQASTVANAENVFSVAANYMNQFDQVTLNASATGEFGSAVSSTQEDLNAYAVGATVGFSGFSFGASYGNWGESLQVKTATNKDDGHYWTVGAGYEVGPFSTSVTYLDSSYQKNDFTNVVLGADYKLAQGLVPYVEVAFFEADPAASATAKNDGTLFLLGTQVNF